MALAFDHYKVIVNLVDSGGNVTTRTFQVDGADETEALTNGGAIVTRLAAITDASIRDYTVGIVLVEDAFALPSGSVNVEEAAEVTGTITDKPAKHAVVSIPAPKIGVFVGTSGPNRNIVDVADTDLNTFMNSFAPGAAGFLSDGETIDSSALVKGKRVHYRSRKG